MAHYFFPFLSAAAVVEVVAWEGADTERTVTGRGKKTEGLLSLGVSLSFALSTSLSF